jgi:hypothetical protein
MSFFERLESFRPTGMSNNAFAEKVIFVGYKQWLDWKRGALPKAVTVEALSKRLGTHPSYLLFGFGPRTQKEADEWIDSCAVRKGGSGK